MTDDELRTAGAIVRGEAIPELMTFFSHNLQGLGVEHTLLSGGLLHLAAMMVESGKDAELFDNLLDDLGLSRTQAFRCRSAWRHFAGALQGSQKVRKFFSSESVKILAEERTPEAAREEALALAAKGERITIKVARALQQKHGVDISEPVVAEPAAPRRERAAAGKWLFLGSVVRIQLTPTKAVERPDVSSVILDLESAIAQLRSSGNGSLVA